ncbi:DUF1266 domain-containing protein [Saccharibacillus sacchari]|uniref:DUF1266 domain-containing protein n=1 Tax=Saccharibacillus sacchari TaxID=456493 RepID=A0ACC6PCT6_9BACL
MDNYSYGRALNWATALGGPLLRQNGAPFPFRFEECVSALSHAKSMLKDTWSVESASDFRHLADRMWSGMHNPGFQQTRLFLSVMTLAERRAYLASLPKNDERYEDVYTTHLYMDRLPPAGIAAWDWGRLAFYIRCARVSGYINEQEENAYLLHNAVRARWSYRNWPDYAVAYMAGRQYWSRDLSEEWSEINLSHLNKLLTDQSSPWRELEWDIVLPEPPELPEYENEENVR